jgi:hypothetical protein
MDLDHLRWRKASYSNNDTSCVEVAAWRKASYSNDGANCVEVGVWRKASYSSNDTSCVEVAAWRKASYTSDGASCVEVGTPRRPAEGAVCLVRDTKDRTGPTLAFPAPQWTAFLATLKRGDLTPTP